MTTEPWKQEEPECFENCPRATCPHFFYCVVHFGPLDEAMDQADRAGLSG